MVGDQAWEGPIDAACLSGQPVVSRHPTVMLVDLAVAVAPTVELASKGKDRDPGWARL